MKIEEMLSRFMRTPLAAKIEAEAESERQERRVELAAVVSSTRAELEAGIAERIGKEEKAGKAVADARARYESAVRALDGLQRDRRSWVHRHERTIEAAAAELHELAPAALVTFTATLDSLRSELTGSGWARFTTYEGAPALLEAIKAAMAEADAAVLSAADPDVAVSEIVERHGLAGLIAAVAEAKAA